MTPMRRLPRPLLCLPPLLVALLLAAAVTLAERRLPAPASGLPCSGDVLDLRAAPTAPVVGVAMTAVSVVLLLLTVALVGYLLWTLVFPERF